MRTGIYFDEKVFWHNTGSQVLFFAAEGWVQPTGGTTGVDTPDSKRRLVNLAAASGLLGRLDRRPSRPATREDLLRYHTADYIDRFKAASDQGAGDLGQMAPFSKGGFEIAAIAAGLAATLVDEVLGGQVRNGYALCRPCGHHALPDLPMGHCLLGNIPIALEAARAKHGSRRIAVVDWDVHHGNGTQFAYYGRSDTLTISLHQDRCFPPGYSGDDDQGEGEGQGYNINIPILAGSGDQVYLHAIDRIVVPALEKFKPDLIVVASGLDGSAVDPLARMMLTSEGFRAMTLRVKAAAERLCEGRLAIIQEGGYSEAYSPFCGHAILEALSGESTEVVDPAIGFFTTMEQGPRATAFQKSLVDEIADKLMLLRRLA